jgi:hypothetical protein
VWTESTWFLHKLVKSGQHQSSTVCSPDFTIRIFGWLVLWILSVFQTLVNRSFGQSVRGDACEPARALPAMFAQARPDLTRKWPADLPVVVDRTWSIRSSRRRDDDELRSINMACLMRCCVASLQPYNSSKPVRAESSEGWLEASPVWLSSDWWPNSLLV